MAGGLVFFKMATLEIRLKRVNKIYYEGVSVNFLHFGSRLISLISDLAFRSSVFASDSLGLIWEGWLVSLSEIIGRLMF